MSAGRVYTRRRLFPLFVFPLPSAGFFRTVAQPMQMQIPGYKILSELGRGGMATVYLADQEKFERKVALKVMAAALNSDPDFKARFIREAKLVAQLSHPNIVAVYDVGEHDGHLYMAMECHTGGDLKAKIRSGISPAEAVKLTCQIARALEFAHAKGVIHRDIKPDNILFRNDGSAVLTDFGIAKQGDAKTQFTQMGMVAGTPKYMSPEQARGLPLDAESDLYSLGIVFYEMLTGTVPFKADDSIALAIKHLKDPPPPLPVVLKKFQPFLDRLLAKEPAKRYHRGGEVAKVLEDMVAGGVVRNLNTILVSQEATQMRPAINSSDMTPVQQSSRSGLVLASVVMLAVGAGAAWYFLAGPGVPMAAPVAVVPVELPPPPVFVAPVVLAPPVVETPAPPPRPAEPSADIKGLLAQAAEALAADRLIKPIGNSAYDYYRQVLIAAPKNKQALYGMERIADRFIELIDEALAAGNVELAKQHLKNGERVAPKYPPLADAATRIANYREPVVATPVVTPAPVVEEPAAPTIDPNVVRNRLRASGLTSKGLTLYKQGDYAGARSHYDQALALDPSNRAALDGLIELKKLGM